MIESVKPVIPLQEEKTSQTNKLKYIIPEIQKQDISINLINKEYA
jgi:hypothetical protein